MTNLLASDISVFVNWFMSLMNYFFTWSYNTLDSIKLGGFSLLTYLVSIMVFSCLIPLLISFAGYDYRQNKKNEARARSKSKKGDDESA